MLGLMSQSHSNSNGITDMRLENLMAVNVKITVFWDGMPCSLVDRYQCFGGTSYLQLQGRRYHIPEYCHVLSDCRQGIGSSSGFIGSQHTLHSLLQYITLSSLLAGPRTSCRPNYSLKTGLLFPTWLYNLGSDHIEKAALILLSGLAVTK
jgi:hypothetical protein